MSKRVAVIDFDGTLVTKRWPEIGEWQPGALQAMLRLHNAGFRLILHSVRLNVYDPFTMADREALAATQYQLVRDKLDQAGLTFIDIWTKRGKPFGDVYIDDRAERYQGRPKSWDKLTEKVLARFGKEADTE